MHQYITHHKKMVYTITGLMAAVLIFAIIIGYLSTRTVTSNPTAASSPSPTSTVPATINLELSPASTTAPINSQVTFVITPKVTGRVTGLDLLFRYDPTMLTLIGVDQVPQGYLKVRSIAKGNTGIVSIIEQLGAQQNASNPATLGRIVFATKKTGQTAITPILRNEATSSIMLIGKDTTNVLTGITSPTIIITAQ